MTIAIPIGTDIDHALAPLDDILRSQDVADCDGVGAAIILEYAAGLAQGRIASGAKQNLIGTFGPEALSVARAIVSLAQRCASKLREKDDE